MALTNKQKSFVDAYLANEEMNATRAYKAVYKNVKSDDVAAVNANRLLRNANVKEYLDQRMEELQKRTEITQDDVVKRLSDIIQAKPTNIVKVEEKDGKQIVTIKNTDDLSEIDQSLISGIKMGRNGIEVTFVDKIKVIELLGKHLGMFKDKLEATVVRQEKSELSELLEQRKKRNSE